MSCLICPVCGAPLLRGEKTFYCENRHSFDISKHGYVNLLLGSQSGKIHGDDKTMVRARNEFLKSGIYDKLSDAVSRLVCGLSPDCPAVADIGCGEGKYTADVAESLKACGKRAEIVGIDISKDALSLAARRKKDVTFAVASVAALPIAESGTDVIINIFAPFKAEEFSRILKPDGIAIRVYPLANHLWELKSIVYETPYKNPEADMNEPGFEIFKTLEVKYTAKLNSRAEIENLFKMTPYFYRTPPEGIERALSCEKLSVSLEFGITVYKNKK